MRLRVLSRDPDPQVAALAGCLWQVGEVAPARQDRWRQIASQQPELFERARTVLGRVYFDKFLAREGGPALALESQLALLAERPSPPPAPCRSAPALTDARTPASAPPSQRSAPVSDGKPLWPRVEIYTDGGCDPNPGPGGYGVVLVHPKKRAEASGAFRRTTNNRMEILAAIKGLEMLKQPCAVTIYSDSQYLVKAISQGWAARWKRNGWRLSTKEPAKNVDLWDRLLALCAVHRVHFKWIRGHAGHRENERCDLLCGKAKAEKSLPPDLGYEAAQAGRDEKW